MHAPECSQQVEFEARKRRKTSNRHDDAGAKQHRAWFSNFPGEEERDRGKGKFSLVEALRYNISVPNDCVCMEEEENHSPAPFIASLSFWTSASGLKPDASVTVPRFPIWLEIIRLQPFMKETETVHKKVYLAFHWAE